MRFVVLLINLITVGARAASYDLKISQTQPLGQWLYIAVDSDTLITGFDLSFSRLPLAVIPGNTFEVYPDGLKLVYGGSVPDVTQPLPSGTWTVGEFEFAPGTLTVSGDVVGVAPTFTETPAAPVTVIVPESTLGFWVTWAAFFWLVFRVAKRGRR